MMAMAVLSPSARAATYYFDSDSSTPGFGTAGGVWAAPTPGPVPGWSTDATGSSIPGSITTATNDLLNFGNGATGLGAGTITLSGALGSSNITFAAGSGAITLSGGTSLSLPLAATITLNNSSDTIATPLAGAGTSLTKAGTGTLILSGVNTISGIVTVGAGELQLNGGTWNLGAKAVNVTLPASANQVAVLNILNGNFTNGAATSIGGGTNAVGVMKMSGGNYVMSANNLNFSSGAGKTNYSALLMSGGFMSIAGEVDIARDTIGASSYFNLSGGTFVCSNFATVGREGFGVLDISGGTFLRPSTAINKFYMNRSIGSFSHLTLRGAGTIDFEDNNGFPFANSSANGGSGVVNLLPGGTLISRVGIFWNGAGMTFGHLNFNGGKLQASGSSATFWTNGWTASYVYSGGATIDSQANSITIGQPLLVPSGGGVTSVTGGTGAGYLAPPVVSISGDGTGATAIAQIDGSGNITNILVSNPGVNYSSATVTLIGGGGTGGGWTANVGANATTGGLTKLGSGTLTLGGANSYGGPTRIGAGTLAISYANYPSTSALTVSNGAALSADVSGGTSTLRAPSLTLGTNAVLNLSYGSLGGNPFQPAISDSSISAGTVLTASGTNIVINLSGSGFDSGQFALIKYSGSIGGNGFPAFKLGTLPSGVPAGSQLVNNTANGSIDLFIPLVNSLTWNGNNGPNWDINTTINWKDATLTPTTYKQYGTTNIYGDEVTFDDSLSNPAQTNINLSTNLRPSTVNVTGSSTPYVFSGTGKLNGGAFLSVGGSASLTINTTNDYTGGSLLNSGTVLAGNDGALGTGPLTLGGGTLASASAAARTFSNTVSMTADSTFGTGPSSGALTFAGSVDLGNSTARGFTHDNTVTFTGPASNGGINKGGSGTLTFDNPGTLLTGGTTVFGGKVAYNNGSYAGAINIAPTISQLGVLEIGSGNVTNTGANNIGTGADSVGVMKQSGGNFVATGAASFGNNGSGSAAYLMSGGFASFGGDTKFDNNGAVGLISQSGGTMVSLNFFTIARDGGLGVYDLSGGTHFRPSTATNFFYLGTRANGGIAQLTIRGAGTLDLEDSGGLWFDHAGDRTLLTFGTVNLLTGGTLISRPGIWWGNSNAASVGYFNFNGGTLRAATDTPNYLTEWTGSYVYPGGAVIDSQSYNVGISQALLTPTGGGVTSITGGSGSGYLSPPVVTISGDGTGAAAVAQIDSSGNITSILVTSPGIDYTSASVSLSGGGGTGSGYTANIGANATTGGVTKIGSGTLTLTGTNNYRGVTTVSNGRLVFGPSHGGTGNNVVSNGAALGVLQDAPGATVHLASATTAAGGGLLAQFTGNTGNPTTIAGYITNLTLNGPTPVSVLCSGIQVGTIPLFQYSSISGAGSITAGTLPQGVIGIITNNTATKTISLIVTGFAPLVWAGTPGNVWDINISANWTLNASPVTYQDGASLVVFDDTAANGTLVITQAVSPASVVFSNSSVAFDVGTSGAGILSGGTGVTKNGSGTATLSGVNSYTGPTIINAGTLQIGNGGASGVLAGDSDITVEASATLAYNSSTAQNNILNNISGTGTVTKSGGQMGWGGTNTFSGTINVLSGKLAFSGSESENGQPNVNISSGAVVSIGAGFAGGVATLGNLSGGGAIDAAFSATVGTRTFQVNQTADGVFTGPIAESSAGRILAMVKTGPAALTLAGTNAFTGGLLVSNGTLVVNGSMISNSVVTVDAGATFGGSGSLVGTVSYVGGSSSTNIVGAPMTIETLDLAGSTTMRIGAATPVAGGSYPLINYTTQTGSGSFTSFSVGGAGLAAGASASLVNSNNAISLNVVGGGGPAATNITFTVTGGQLILNWPAGQGWQLQAQTNALSVGLRTNWVTISGATPPLTNAISPATPAVFYRLKF